jgi:hypothetical protein
MGVLFIRQEHCHKLAQEMTFTRWVILSNCGLMTSTPNSPAKSVGTILKRAAKYAKPYTDMVGTRVATPDTKPCTKPS